MARPKEFLMKELRAVQKRLLSAARCNNQEKAKALRAEIAQLRKEMENAE